MRTVTGTADADVIREDSLESVGRRERVGEKGRVWENVGRRKWAGRYEGRGLWRDLTVAIRNGSAFRVCV